MEPMLLLLDASLCSAGVRVKLKADDPRSFDMDESEEEEVVGLEGSNHTGGLVEVSDLLRFRVNDGADRSEVSLKEDARLCCNCGEEKG